MKSLIKEIRYWLVSVFIKWILAVCPNCRFKDLFCLFLKDNIQYLVDDITDEFITKKVCENKVDGVCPLHNLFCKYPDCEK
jgi:hypothetical protein